MGSCLIEKMSHYTELTQKEENLIARLEDEKVHYKAGERIRAKGDGFEDLYVIYEGWTYVSSTLEDGLRSIFDVRLEGDFVGISELSFNHRLYDFHALTDVTVCPFPKRNLDDMFMASPKLRDVFFLILSREQAIAYERIMTLGRRTAMERVAHFILELSLRHEVKGSKPKYQFDFPLRQDHMADILGMSPVHVSRAMKKLKDNGYIDYNRRKMVIKQPEKLFTLTRWNPQFLLAPKQVNNYEHENVVFQVKKTPSKTDQ